jgi:hypothetical protein
MAAMTKSDHHGTYEVTVTFDAASAAAATAVPPGDYRYGR